MGEAGRTIADVVVDVSGLPTADLSVVDGLARLQLAAGRVGARVHLRGVEPRLASVLRLVGLGPVLLDDPVRQPEEGEQLREQEVVDGGDPLA